MKMNLVGLGLVTSVLLAGCQTSGVVLVSDVQREATAICGYLPLAQVVKAIIGKHNANLDSVFSIASAICGAVVPKPSFGLAKANVPTVAGVVIRGKFVR